MALKFKQFRYFGIDNAKNANTTFESNTLTLVGFDQLTSIKHLGIQTMPGVEFNINGGTNDTPNIIIGPSGIYEINVEETGSTIGSLDIVESTFMHYFNSNGNNTAYLIVDVVYEDGGNS